MPSRKAVEEAAPQTASTEPVRFEVTFSGEKHKHRVETDVFIRGFGVRRVGELIHLHMDVVDITMPRGTMRDFLSKGLHMLDAEDQWPTIEPILNDLHRQGHKFREP